LNEKEKYNRGVHVGKERDMVVVIPLLVLPPAKWKLNESHSTVFQVSFRAKSFHGCREIFSGLPNQRKEREAGGKESPNRISDFTDTLSQ
jgi:hypothetical protein